MKKNECLYFRCRGGKGHFLWTTDGRTTQGDTAGLPFPWHNLDRGFLPDGHKEDQGAAKLTIVVGHTVLSFADRSIDTRPGCHSTFVAGGELDFDQMVKLAKSSFNEVWERYAFKVTEVK